MVVLIWNIGFEPNPDQWPTSDGLRGEARAPLFLVKKIAEGKKAAGASKTENTYPLPSPPYLKVWIGHCGQKNTEYRSLVCRGLAEV